MQSAALQIQPEIEVDFTNCLPAEAPDILALANSIAAEYHESADAVLWRDIFCYECGVNECLLGTALQLARQAYSHGWAMDFKNPICPKCANYEPELTEEEELAEHRYAQWKESRFDD